jgi:hypothetical protein
MNKQGRWPGRLGLALAALSLLGGGGCLSFCHPVEPVTKEKAAPCQELPPGCRNRVYVFFVHGLDPLDFADLSGVRDYVQSLGFIKTYYGQLYHRFYFERELRRIHHEDPEARFVLVGFSLGANMVRDLANAVKDDGVTIDLMVFLGGNTIYNTPDNQPEHVGHIVNILATGCIWNGDTLDRAENYHYSNVWHFGSPTHPHTLEVLARELAVVASRVPVVVRVPPPPPPLVEGAPLPRPVMPRADQPRDEWDFLKPAPGGLDESRLPPNPQAGNEVLPPPTPADKPR